MRREQGTLSRERRTQESKARSRESGELAEEAEIIAVEEADKGYSLPPEKRSCHQFAYG